MLNILMMGAGAIGCFMGGSLVGSGHQVTLVGRQPLMDKIARDGLTIRWPNRPPQTIFPTTATTVAATDRPYDFIFVTVKMPGLPTAAAQLATLSLEAGQTCLVAMQNGIGAEEQLADTFGAARVIAGTITIPIRVPEAGVIEVSKNKGGVGLAPLVANQPVGRLADALNRANLPTRVYNDYRAMKWSKLLLNIVTNATSAILNEPPARVIEHPAIFNLEIKALQEAIAVIQAQDIPAVSLPDYPVDWLARLVSARWLPMALKRALLRPSMQKGRGAKMPSLQLDLAAGRSATEIDALNGAVVQAGQKYGILTPVNQTLTEIFNGLVSGRLNWSEYQHQPDKLLAHLDRSTG